MTVLRVLDCSTEHLSPAAKEWLSECSLLNLQGHGAAISCISEHLYGWFMHAPALPAEQPDAIGHGIPEDLHPVILHAHKQECTYILFDSDADTIDGLPLHDD